MRVQWSGADLRSFGENDPLTLESKLSRYGSKMFFSHTKGSGDSGKFRANLISVFSSRKASDNTQLGKGSLHMEPDGGVEVKVYKQLLKRAKEYLER